MKKVLILGLGRIGLGEKNIKSFNSHVNFFYKSKQYKIVGVIEKNRSKLKIFKKNFKGIQHFESIEKFLKYKIEFDVIQINFNDYNILELLNKIDLKKKIIFFEKPLTNTASKFKRIITELRKNKILINYQRLSNLIYLKEFKKIKLNKNIFFNIVYNKGVLNNASHIISLLIFHFGKPKSFKVHQIYNRENIDFILFFSDGNKATFQSQINVNYNLLEMDIYYNNGKTSFLSGGHDIYKYGIKKYKFLNNYNLLNKTKKSLSLSQIKNNFMNKKILSNKNLLKKYILSSYETVKLIEKLKNNGK